MTEADSMDQITLQRVLKMVHQYTGITMNESKKVLLQARLRNRLKELSLSSYNEYLNYLANNKGEIQSFVNLVTTNETSFFRTTRLWDYFQKTYLPDWFQAHPQETLKVWSAASSTGEEAYTIAICCQEFKEKNPLFNYQIVGTDIDTDVLAVASRGEYEGRSLEGFKSNNPILCDKYLIRTGQKHKISDEIKSHVRFQTHNLFHAPFVKSHFNLIFLRNVLIYFEKHDQEKVLTQVHSALTPSGLLVIGESESLTPLKSSFQFTAPLIYKSTGSSY